jgi:RNA polymerase sigma factor (sigma-70 family)
MGTDPFQDTLQPLTRHVEGVLARNRGRFLSFLERRLGSRALAEEALQSALLRGLDRPAPEMDEQGAVRWLYRVLTNAVVDTARRDAAERRALDVASRGAPPWSAPELQETVCQCIGELLTTLRPEYAESLRRVDLEGRSVAEFARAAGITSNNASVRLHRARAALRAQLLVSCGACAEHGCLDCGCSRR